MKLPLWLCSNKMSASRLGSSTSRSIGSGNTPYRRQIFDQNENESLINTLTSSRAKLPYYIARAYYAPGTLRFLTREIRVPLCQLSDFRFFIVASVFGVGKETTVSLRTSRQHLFVSLGVPQHINMSRSLRRSRRAPKKVSSEYQVGDFVEVSAASA